MVVLAIAVTTKSGKPLVSRQFRPLPKSRIDSLLTAFPKLIPLGSQHTTVETSDVRYVYQPFDESYVVVVTNKGSNILQDIATLSLIVRLVTSLTPSMAEPAVLANSFELLCAFDEVVSLGYKENVSLQQIRNVLEGESHEEKIQDIIARNKEAEAKEELKRRAKQLEMQRREQQRTNPGSNGRANQSTGFQAGGASSGGSIGSYAPIPRQEPHMTERDLRSNSPANSVKPSFKGSGMKLGKKVKQSELLDAMGTEASLAEASEVAKRTSPPMHSADKLEAEELEVSMRKGVDITIQETINARISRHGDLESLDIRGDMDLRINEPAYGKITLRLADVHSPYLSGDMPLQFQQHPNVKKFTASSSDKTISLKDPARNFPVGQGLGVLRWKFVSKDENLKPLNVTCWPSENSDGTTSVSIEYDLAATQLELKAVVISIPLEQKARDINLTAGEWSITEGFLLWELPRINREQPAGTLEFNCGNISSDSFFPIGIEFVSDSSLCGVKILEVLPQNELGEIPVNTETRVTAGSYCVI